MQALPLHRYTLAHSDATRMITPALCVHLDKVRHNVRTMIHGHMGGRADKWRPHVKTIKTPELMQELVDAGVRKFKCATPRELEVLCGTLEAANVAAESDVLVAFAHVGANLRRVAEVGLLRHARHARHVSPPDHGVGSVVSVLTSWPTSMPAYPPPSLSRTSRASTSFPMVWVLLWMLTHKWTAPVSR